MSTHDSVRLPDDDLPGALPTGDPYDRLSDVLAAAAGPASPAELAGEAAAVAAFRAAHPAPARAEIRRKPVMKSTFATRLSIKAAVAAIAVTSMGGVALAATGNMPSPLPGNGKSAEERTADKAARDAEKLADDSVREIEQAEKDSAKAEKAADKTAREAAKAAEAHGFQGLCTAFLAHPADANNGKWYESTAFMRLRTAVGPEAVASDVRTYCDSLLADAAAETPADAPAEESTTAEVETPGKAADNHGKGKDAEHGKDGMTKAERTAVKEARQGAEDDGRAAGSEHSRAGADNGNAGDKGQGAENGEAGQEHGQAGLEHPAPRG